MSHLAKGSIRNYRAETKFLIEFLELKQITEVEEVKAHHIRDFMKQKQDSGNMACYVNDILKACKTWFNYLVEEDYIEERRNPAAKVKYLKQPQTIIETFSTQEVKELIHYYSGCDYLEVKNKTIITLLFDTGMCCNETIMMEPEDIKKDYIVVKHGKGNKERVVPKSPMLSKQLVRYLYVRENYFEGKSNKKKQHFQQTVVCRENTLGFCDLPQLPIKAFNRVRGIDQTADFLRIFEVGAEVGPVFPPRL